MGARKIKKRNEVIKAEKNQKLLKRMESVI